MHYALFAIAMILFGICLWMLSKILDSKSGISELKKEITCFVVLLVLALTTGAFAVKLHQSPATTTTIESTP